MPQRKLSDPDGQLQHTWQSRSRQADHIALLEKENFPPWVPVPDLKVMEYPSLNIASGTSPSPALSLDNIHDQYAAEINHSLDDFILVESDSDVKYSDIELDERLEAPGGETWQNTGVDSHMVVDYISDDFAPLPSNLSSMSPHIITPVTPPNAVATAHSTTQRIIKRIPFILLKTLPPTTSILYQEVELSAIDKLAKGSRSGIATEVGELPPIGQKRPRRQPQHSRDVSTLHGSSYDASDEGDESSNTEELDHQQQSSRKRLKSTAYHNRGKEHKPPTKAKAHSRRDLAALIDWNDRRWEKQKVPADLVASINSCAETKGTRSTTDPCPVLSLLAPFGVRWSHSLNCFYCFDHSRLVPGDGFRGHFGGRVHPMAIPGTTRYIYLTVSAFHLAECYPSMRNQSYDGLKLSLPAQLQEPIQLNSGSDTVQMRYKCPYATCDVWMAVNEGRGAPVSELRRHVKTHDNILKKDFPTVSAQWTQLVAVGQGWNGITHVFTFPDNYRPLTENVDKTVFSTVDLAAPSTDTWATSFGWEDYIDKLIPKFGSRQKAVVKLRDLVSLPSASRISGSTGLVNLIERGLLVSNKLNIAYLDDAVNWVSLMHPSFRSHFGQGRKKPFQPFVHKDQYYKYREPLILVEAFIVRSIHDKVWDHPDAIPIEHSDETAQAGLALYKYFLTSCTDLDPEELMTRKHNLFLAILQAGQKSEKKVASPLDQVILARNLLASGQWRKATLSRSFVTVVLWVLSAIDAHWCRHAATGDEGYIPFSLEQSHIITPDLSEVDPPNHPALPVDPSIHEVNLGDRGDEESEEDIEENDEIEAVGDELTHGLGFGEIDAAKLEETLRRISRALDTVDCPNFTTKQAGPFSSPAIKQVLKSRLQYISPAGETKFITAFQRALSVSSALFKQARHKPPFTATFQDGCFILTNHVDSPVSLPLQTFREAASLSSNDFKTHVEAALPTGVLIYDIQINGLTDDFASGAIHQQPQNAALLQPLISEYWKRLLAGPKGGQALFNKDGVVRTEVDRWLKTYDDCFSSATTAMILNSAGFDPSSFKNYCYNGPHRNVFLLRNGVLAFVIPVSSHRVTESHLNLVIVPVDVSRFLLVLICILLPIANNLRALKGQFLPFHSTHLWVLPRQNTTGNGHNMWGYSCNDVNKPLMDLTTQLFGVCLDGELIRKMVYQVFSSEFPLLFSNAMHLRSPVDDVAQHLWITGLHHYGKLGLFPRHSALVGDCPTRNVVYGEVWQALTNTGPIHESWRPMVQGTTLFPVQTFPADAFCVARSLVLVVYKIQKDSQPVDREQRVKQLLTTKPFLRGITPLDKAVIIGDHPLHVILRTLILGLGRSNSQMIPITESHVAESIVLLMRAVYEWASGYFTDLSAPSCESAMHFESVHSRLLKKLAENKFCETESWKALGVVVSQEMPMFSHN